jgi:hypothetical protein
MGEIHYFRPLYDLEGALESLKNVANNYPPRLKRALIRAVGGTLRARHLPKAGGEGRRLLCHRLSHPVRGLHGAGPVRPELAVPHQRKGSVEAAASLPLCPTHFKQTINSVPAQPGEHPKQLETSVEHLENLQAAEERLCAS